MQSSNGRLELFEFFGCDDLFLLFLPFAVVLSFKGSLFLGEFVEVESTVWCIGSCAFTGFGTAFSCALTVLGSAGKGGFSESLFEFD
jgi:hypothetical protein